MADIPNSYKDPYWSDLASKAEARVGVPAGMLVSVLLNGEKSNNDQISEAGAKTPFQIIPSTRKLIIKKYGIDPYLSPENAAEGAALLLDESLKRNKGDKAAAIGEYIGGINRANWGPTTKAYINRVVGGAAPVAAKSMLSDFDSWAADNGFTNESNAQTDQVKQIGADFDRSMQQAPSAQTTEAAPQKDGAPDVASIGADFDQWQAAQPAQAAPQSEMGFIEGLKEHITGTQRATPETQSLPEWVSMPELNELSMASAKTGLGTMFAAPDEIAQVIKVNFPNTQVRQDAKGNYVFTSGKDGKEYVIPPGVSVGDIPRIIGGLASFTPAGAARSVVGSGLAAAGTQAAIEGSQAATGGNFDPASVAAAGAAGAIAPPLLKGVQAVGAAIASPVKSAISRTVGRDVAPIVESATEKSVAGGVPGISATPEATQGADRVVVTGLPQDAAPATIPVDMAKTTRAAARGNENAINELAVASAPDRKVLEASDRIGVRKYLQADHISTSQQFREVAQVIKSVPTSQMAIAEKEGFTEIAKRADDLIDELGGTADLSSSSSKIKTSLQDTYSQLKKGAGKIYDEIDAKLLKTATSAPAPKTLAFVEQRAKELGGAENLTAGERQILKVLTPSAGKEPTYGLLDQIRKEIGAAKRSAQNTFGTSDARLLGQLEDVLRADQGAIAELNGLGQKWEVARGLTRQYKGVEDDLTALFGKALDKDMVGNFKTAVGDLPKGSPSKFINLLKSVPEEMRQELTASGLATAFSKNKGGLNFNDYNQWYEGLLKNKQSYTTLMANLPPAARKQLSDLYRVSKAIQRSTYTKITNGRLSEGTKRLETADGIAGKIMEAAKYDLPANIAGAAAGTVVGSIGGPVLGGGVGLFVKSALSKGAKLPGVQAAEKLLLSPEFTEAVNLAASGKIKPAAAKLARAPIFVDFVKKVRLTELDSLNARERWIIQSLEASQQTNSQQGIR